MEKSDLLWVMWVHGIYMHNDEDFWTYVPPNDSSWYWRTLHKMKHRMISWYSDDHYCLNSSGKYSVVGGYEELIGDGAKEPTANLIWTKLALPKHRFILWLATQRKMTLQRVPCNYPQTTVTFQIDQGSNPSYFSCVIEFQNGEGDLNSVELRATSSDQWLQMKQSWGANWKIELPPQIKPPFSIRLTTLDSKKTLVADDVIPVDWAPGKSYRSLVNF
ncbi:putative expansin-B2 [Lycium barbarum]|uniref:putative expansin-B2 n=1 Tax=Lycium barbarum TaxID=112863 RepID=UPI00293F0B9B|nr:putative expansin-B2 [Lycium barbarum]